MILLAAALFPLASTLASPSPPDDAVLTPQGTWIVPPPGAPRLIVLDTAPDALPPVDETASPWMPTEERDAGMRVSACTPYEAGWYETNLATLHGGHVGIIPRNNPPSFTNFCSGMGLGYTAGVSFGSNSWIQAGLAIFPGEAKAKWFCQANDNGAYTTRYGSANAYSNGATVYTWFARDSGGTWRTYRYDTGPYSVDLGCSISRGASGNLQLYGELQGVTSTSAPMGPWDMFDVRYQDTSGQWWVPSQMQASYPYGMTCPPYGAGTIASGVLSPGSGRVCTGGTAAYPN